MEEKWIFIARLRLFQENISHISSTYNEMQFSN